MKKGLIYDINFLLKNKIEWVATLLFGIAVIISLNFLDKSTIEQFNTFGSTLQSIGILATVLISVYLLRQERLKVLDKKLTVIFVYDNKPVMVCENAYLAGISDIRQWGQSIGQLMNHGERLHFEPFIQENDTVLIHNSKQYRLYTARFTLNELPPRFEVQYNRGEYLIWRCSIENDAKIADIGRHIE